MSKKVYVGLSGGVDSSVTARLLIDAGYDVTGVYMKNWSKDLPGFECPWKEDYRDAKRIAVQLGIPFKMFDFEKQYRERVVDYMVREYQAGRTPNPDIMCNQEIKFKLFLEASLADGADMIATGHYAKKLDTKDAGGKAISKLGMAKDDNKDQTYFLYRVSDESLDKTLFPLGEHTKPEVRELAKKFGLITASKKESMGICFVGKVGIKDFLLHELGPQENGDIVDQDGHGVGRHEGAIFYTIGQRHGLDVGGGLPYYVVDKDMAKNIVFVTTNIDDDKLWHSEIKLTQLHFINKAEDSVLKNVKVRTRHRADLIDCVVEILNDSKAVVKLKDPIRALTAGQSAVIYKEDVCLGGGIIV